MKYTFGTGKVAADRLKKVNRVFNPYSVELIRKHVVKPIECIVDMGCGPGFTVETTWYMRRIVLQERK
jgi:hypothetical protein